MTDHLKNEIIIKADSLNSALIETEKILCKISDLRQLEGDVFGNMLVSLTEAVTNAIQHGNKQKGVIILTYVIEANSVLFIVRDEGRGFDYSNLPDPLAEENLENPRGRGLFLINSLADKVELNEQGNEISMYFNI